MIDPQTLVEIIPNEDGYSLSWKTAVGDCLCVHELSLDAVLNKAHGLDTESCNREVLLRMAFTPTAKTQDWGQLRSNTMTSTAGGAGFSLTLPCLRSLNSKPLFCHGAGNETSVAM